MSTTNICSGALTASKDKNLEILGKILKQVRKIVMGEMDEDLQSMEDVNKTVKAFSAHKRA